MSKRLLVKNGTILDPAEGIKNVKKDILIEDGLFCEIADCMEPTEDMEVFDIEGYTVCPGIIDLHVHVYHGGQISVNADEIGVKQGVTTLIDAGSAGPLNIKDFIDTDIKNSRTRIFSALNYAKNGLENPPEANDPSKYDVDLAVEACEKYKDYIVAVKLRASNSVVGELGIIPIKAGKEVARRAKLPMIVHIGHMPPTIEEVLDLMEKGDIITHAFHGKDNNLFDHGSIKPQTQAARDRGVLFDVGHGKDSFNFETAKLAKSLDFVPDIVSTDLHSQSMASPVVSMSVTMDKMLALGFSLEDVIEKSTAKPAQALHLDKLGKIRKGCLGDLSIFKIVSGKYEFLDANKNVLHGNQSIQIDAAIVGGKIEMNKIKEA